MHQDYRLFYRPSLSVDLWIEVIDSATNALLTGAVNSRVGSEVQQPGDLGPLISCSRLSLYQLI